LIETRLAGIGSFRQGQGAFVYRIGHRARIRQTEGKAMLAFLRSDLFLRFLGGFVIGTIGVVALHGNEQPILTRAANAAPTTQNASL
jgi:hypothetical protein